MFLIHYSRHNYLGHTLDIQISIISKAEKNKEQNEKIKQNKTKRERKLVHLFSLLPIISRETVPNKKLNHFISYPYLQSS